MTSRITQPWSPIEIEVKLAQNIEELEEAVTLQKALAETWANAQHAYKVTQAQRTLQAAVDPSMKTVAHRDAWVMTQVADLMLARDIAEGQLDAQKNVVRALTSQGEQLRSLARSSRDMTDGPGWGGQPQR